MTVLRRSALLLAVALAACSESPRPAAPLRVTADLLALLPYTDDAPRTVEIHPGDPADRPHLLRGWSAPVTLPSGVTGARFASGRTAVLVFHAGHKPQPLVLRVERSREHPEPPRPSRRSGRARRKRRSRLAVEVNGVTVRQPERPDDPGLRTYEIPVELVQSGRNLILLREPASRRRVHGAPEPHHWVYTRFVLEAKRPDALGPHVDGDRLVLPPGTAVHYFLRAPRDARLRFDLVRDAPKDGTPLAVSIATDAGGTRRLDAGAGETDTARIYPIDVAPGEPMRLTLAAGDTGGRAVELGQPLVEGRLTIPHPGAVAAGRPNIILYVVDTLRADQLGCYGATPSRTPEIDRLAAESVLFEHALAQSPWTRPSTATMLTGRYPSAHGAITLRTPLRGDVPTLATVLGAAGWNTAAFVTNLNVAPAFGFGDGFTSYEYLPEDVGRPGVYVPARELHAKALSWIETHRERPFFLYLHATDPHAPYRPTTPALATRPAEEVARLNVLLLRAPQRLGDDDVATLHALYAAETEEFDAELGRFRARLAALGLADDTVLVFVADHGEEFRDHGGLQHGRTLHQEVLHVPLMIRLPGGRHGGRRVGTLARQVDLVPTLRALAGLPPDAALPGTALPLDDAVGDDTFAEAVADTWFGEEAQTALVAPPWKVVLPRLLLAARPAVYDLAADPTEHHDVARMHPVLLGYAKQRIAEVEAAHGALAPVGDAEAAPDPAALERLRALGYVVD